jgi:hypothetical protein
MVLVQPVLHRLLKSNETVRNVPKHEFWVQWSGSGAFVTKNSDPTSFSELVRYWWQFGQFCFEFRVVVKLSETPQNLSFGSNGVYRVRSLWKIPTQLRLANLGVNGARSTSSASTFEKVTKRFEMPENMSFGSNGVDRVRSLWKFQRNFV